MKPYFGYWLSVAIVADPWVGVFYVGQPQRQHIFGGCWRPVSKSRYTLMTLPRGTKTTTSM